MVLCVKIVWTSRSHLGGPITGSGASYWSGIVSAMARVGLGRVLDWPVLTAWCPDARRWIGTCVAPSLRLCQSHGCRDVAACAPYYWRKPFSRWSSFRGQALPAVHISTRAAAGSGRLPAYWPCRASFSRALSRARTNGQALPAVESQHPRRSPCHQTIT